MMNKKIYLDRSFWRFFKILMTEKKAFILMAFSSLISNLLMTSIPFIMGIGIDRLLHMIQEVGLRGVTIRQTYEILSPLILMMISFELITFFFSYTQEKTMAKASEKITLNLRKQLTTKYTKLPMEFFDTHQVGDILSRSTTDLNKVANVLLTGINQMMSSIATIFFGVLMLFYISPALTVAVLGIMGMNFFVTKWISAKNKEFAEKSYSELGHLTNFAEEYYTGTMIVKSFNQQKAAIQSFNEINLKQTKAFKKAQFVNFGIYPLIRFLNQLAFVVSAIFGAKLVLSGAMSLGTIQAYLQYVNQISEPLTQSSYVINSIQSAMASMERIFEILDAKEEMEEAKTVVELKNPQGEIAFNHVQFGYDSKKMLMEDVDFVAKAHETVAIVGPTGAGKTTLVNLLLRFYELNGGEITFDGEPITNLSRSHLRSMFGMVLQDTWLFEGTIAENLAYGKRDATRNEIIEAAKIAQCHHFIQTLPDGYDTIISSEENMISQGQQQLLTIARIILANPAIVILDEATSSVDTRTEIEIQKAMNHVMKGRTSFVIAHRLSTIQSADLILVMKEGTIIEQGTHLELLNQDSFYSDLYNSQFS
ncbi:ABC transporter ATP-binding protein [Carnobacterium divergens]|uniref:ABC transporter ATP-binding protein n=1 Tax=Carnobacterium divergens TaxID=2748 RepID=UPI0039AEB077